LLAACAALAAGCNSYTGVASRGTILDLTGQTWPCCGWVKRCVEQSGTLQCEEVRVEVGRAPAAPLVVEPLPPRPPTDEERRRRLEQLDPSLAESRAARRVAAGLSPDPATSAGVPDAAQGSGSAMAAAEQRAVAPQMGMVQSCAKAYARTLRQAVVRLTVEPDGAVSAAKTDGLSPASSFAQCLERTLGTLRLPESTGRASRVVTVAFDLATGRVQVR
jgi:hypothetical protein